MALLERVGALNSQWNGYNRVVSRGNAAAAQDLGVVPHRGPGYRRVERHGRHAQQILQAAANGEIRVLFLLGCDPTLEGVDTALARSALAKALVIYVGAYQTAAAQKAAVVLPGLATTERVATLTNLEGRAQRSDLAVMGPLQAKEDWRIFRALSDRFAKPLPYNTREALQSLLATADHRYALDDLEAGELTAACDHKPVTTGLPIANGASDGEGVLLVLEPPFFQDDAIARQSSILSQLTLGRSAPLGSVRINPHDANKAGIANGQKIRIISAERHLECIASLDEKVPARVVFGDMGQSAALMQDLCNWDGGFAQVSLVAL